MTRPAVWCAQRGWCAAATALLVTFTLGPGCLRDSHSPKSPASQKSVSAKQAEAPKPPPKTTPADLTPADLTPDLQQGKDASPGDLQLALTIEQTNEIKLAISTYFMSHFDELYRCTGGFFCHGHILLELRFRRDGSTAGLSIKKLWGEDAPAAKKILPCLRALAKKMRVKPLPLDGVRVVYRLHARCAEP